MEEVGRCCAGRACALQAPACQSATRCREWVVDWPSAQRTKDTRRSVTKRHNTADQRKGLSVTCQGQHVAQLNQVCRIIDITTCASYVQGLAHHHQP